MSAPFVQTSRLSNILQMISLARQTGILRVIRGQGATREMGQIRFIDGQAVSALLGQLTGDAALGVLNNWGECHYAFDELAMADVVGQVGPLTPSGPLQTPSAGTPSAVDLSGLGMPAAGWAGVPPYTPNPGSPSNYQSPATPVSDTSWPVYSYQQSGLFSGSGGGPPLGSFGGSGPYASPGYASQPSAAVSTPAGYLGSSQGQLVSTFLASTVPQRTALAERIEHLPLDRRERMVLLLVDGQRAVGDLARLTRRSEAEVQAVLQHLELLGLITVGR